jgi:hypothetical protein
MILMGFAAIEAAKAFVGEDCEAAYLPAAARAGSEALRCALAS